MSSWEVQIDSEIEQRWRVGVAAMALGTLCWGLTPVFLRSLASSVDAWTANGFRYPMAAILYWPLLLSAFRDRRLHSGLIWKCTIPAVFALSGQVFWALSHYELEASQIGFFIRVSTLWTLVGSMWLFPDERKLLGLPGFYGGVAMITIGYVVLASPTTALVAPSVHGLTLIGLCSLFFGMYIVSVRWQLPKANPVLAFATVSQFVAAGSLIGMFLFGEPRSLLHQSPRAWMLLICSSILGIACGHILMYTSIQRLGASITSISQSLMPLVTAIAAGLTLGETLTFYQWIGGVVMLIGTIVLLLLKQVTAISSSAGRSR